MISESAWRSGLGAETSLEWCFFKPSLLSLIGIVIGIASSFALTRLIKSQLFGITPTDPITIVAVSLILALVSLIASYVPARRAAKVNPLVALRYE